MADLLESKALIYEDHDHLAPKEGPVPEEYLDAFYRYREAMVEKIVETDDGLMVKYLDGEQIDAHELRGALRKATIAGNLVPVLCGSALGTRGIHPLMEAVIYYLPAPVDIPPVKGILFKSGEEVTREAREDAPLAALAFKVSMDSFVGRLVYLRVYSGKVSAGASVLNSTKDVRERMGRVLQMHANRRDEVEETTAGNICAAVGLKNTFTGDTICTREDPVILEPPQFPSPVLSVAIEPMTRADQDKLSDALRKLSEEDPTFEVRYNDETGQTLISGMGELHLEVTGGTDSPGIQCGGSRGQTQGRLSGSHYDAGAHRRPVHPPDRGQGNNMVMCGWKLSLGSGARGSSSTTVSKAE